MSIDEMIQTAGAISRELGRVKRAEKTLEELHRIQNGRVKQFEGMLEFTESQIDVAMDRANEEFNYSLNELRKVMV